jgi:two-component system sensor histidine kinase/response regulator
MAAIDLTVLDGIRDLADGDSGFLTTLIQLFIDSAPEKVQKMKAALAGNDAKNASFEAHSLKSSSASLGAFTVSRLAAEIEKETKAGGISPALIDKFTLFEKEFSLALQELKAIAATDSQSVKKAA